MWSLFFAFLVTFGLGVFLGIHVGKEVGIDLAVAQIWRTREAKKKEMR